MTLGSGALEQCSEQVVHCEPAPNASRVIVGNLGTCGEHDIIAVKMVFLQVCPPMLLDLLAKVLELGLFGLSMSALARAKKLAKSLWAMTN